MSKVLAENFAKGQISPRKVHENKVTDWTYAVKESTEIGGVNQLQIININN
jgi:hypothetical protein